MLTGLEKIFLENWFNLCIFENARKPCSRDIFVIIMDNKFRKNITVCIDYFYWNIILLNGLRCIKRINFLSTSSTSIAEKLKCPWWFPFIFIILGSFWNFLIRYLQAPQTNFLLIPKSSTTASEYDLNVSATSLSSKTTLPHSIGVILLLSLTLLEKKSFTVFQNCLLSVIFLTLRLLK